MKVQRRGRETGPTFTIESTQGSRPAKYAGELPALIEAQNEALAAREDTTVRVMDEDLVIFTVTRRGKEVLTH